MTDPKGTKSPRSGGLGELVAELICTALPESEAVYYPVGKVDFGLDGLLQVTWEGMRHLIGVQAKTVQKPTKGKGRIKLPEGTYEWLLDFRGPMLLVCLWRTDRSLSSMDIYDYKKFLTRNAPKKSASLGCRNDPAFLKRIHWKDLARRTVLKTVLDQVIDKRWISIERASRISKESVESDLARGERVLARARGGLVAENLEGNASKAFRARLARRIGDYGSARKFLVKVRRQGPYKACDDSTGCCPHYERAVLEHETALREKDAFVRRAQLVKAVKSALSILRSHQGKKYTSTRARTAVVGMGFCCDGIIECELRGQGNGEFMTHADKFWGEYEKTNTADFKFLDPAALAFQGNLYRWFTHRGEEPKPDGINDPTLVAKKMLYKAFKERDRKDSALARLEAAGEICRSREHKVLDGQISRLGDWIKGRTS
jgi:hypothetical protein